MSRSHVPTLPLLALSIQLLAGCSEEATAPERPLLVGEWGSEAALFIALRSGAEVQLGCAVVIVDEPITLATAGAFAIVGRLQTSSAVLGALPRIHGTGEVDGSRVVLSLPVGSGGELRTLSLQAGIRPPQGEGPTCPQ
jgi:hypothetical protein